MTDTTTASALPLEERTARLDAEVARQVSKGWTVASRSDSQAILTQVRRMSVFWNVILTLLTGGLWLIVIAIRLANRKPRTRAVTVDTLGRVSVR